jgi:DNA mismatch repair protein MutL
MPDRIRILDEKVISQIAAGEVIERPVSVVKELVENSIDAQARRIHIELEEGGKRLIRVEDDGIGMNRKDAETAFLRHSTSKINTLRDLEAILSLGFRGEALASIAAVSKVSLITKSRDEDGEGTEIYAEGSKIRHVKDAAANAGTVIAVRDLFYNTPARRKYLKTQRTELAKISDLVSRQALIHPEISFMLIHEGSEIINAPEVGNLLDNIVHLYGMDTAREMLSVEYSDLDYSISGFISKPAVTRKSKSHISFFINKRYVVSKLLSSALKDGYGNLIMKNRYPVAVLDLTIDPRKIDVNVHPTKLEIRFEDDRDVSYAIHKAVEEALEKHSLIPDMGAADVQKPTLAAFESQEGDLAEGTSPIPEIEAKRQINIESFDVGGMAAQPIEHEEDVGTSTLPKMYLIGQTMNTYIVAQSGNDVLFIDQHAAHERVLFEKLRSYKRDDMKNRQELLSPITIELSPRQKSFVSAHTGILDGLGFRLEHFGANTYQVTSVPVTLSETGDSNTVIDIIDEFAAIGRSKGEDEMMERAAAVVACHSAIRGGDILSPSQMKELLASLYGTDNVYSCPHGRPTILSISRTELEKRFKRK